jgi:hypothetical protein
MVEKAIYAAAGRYKVSVTGTSYVLMLDDPRRTVKQFKQAMINDQQCLSGILDVIDQDFLQATERANAWATGDISALKRILSASQQDECLSAVGDTGFAKTIGITDIPHRIQQAWIKAAEVALAHNPQSVALLPMREVTADVGYLEMLQKDGYTVESPEPLAEASTD